MNNLETTIKARLTELRMTATELARLSGLNSQTALNKIYSRNSAKHETLVKIAEALKIPVSTTHTITGSIIGVGATKRLSAVRWGVTFNLLWAWILTIPVSAFLAACIYWLMTLLVPSA